MIVFFTIYKKKLNLYRINIAILIFLFAILIGRYSFATDLYSPEDISIEADTIENFIERKLKASGNAIIKKADKTISADEIEYDQISEDLYARGNVILTSESSRVEGNELNLSLLNNTGSIPNASFTTVLEDSKSKFNNKLRGTASFIFLEGQDKKILENASITTCQADQDDWFIKASEVEVNEKSQRVKATDAKVEFFGYPLFYTPYANFSFNDQRKSGFLTPSIGSTSRSGFESSIPYYFNLAPNRDATLTPRYFGKRGFQIAGEYRYLMDNYQGLSYAEFMPSDDAKTERKERYYFKFNHDQQFDNGVSAYVRYEKVSDNDYFADSSSLVSQTSRVNLPREIKINYKNELFDATLMAQEFQNLNSSSPYERLPSLQINHEKEFTFNDGQTNIETFLNFEATKFERNNDFVGVSPHGMRITARPSFAIPIEASYGYIKPKISFDMKHYDLNGSSTSTENLFIPTFSIDSSIFLDRQFEYNKSSITQTLEPRIFYSYTDYEDQSMLPLFDTALLDLNQNTIYSENQFIGNDRVMDSHQITLGLTSRFIDSIGFERLSMSISQRFYIDDRKVLNEVNFASSSAQSDSSDIFMSANAMLTKSWKLYAEHQYNVDEESTNRLAFSSKYNPDIGKLIDLSYRFINNPNSSADDLKQFNLAGQWPAGSGYSFIGRYNYDIKNHGIVEGLGGLNYDAGCWSSSLLIHRMSLATSEKPNYTLFFMLELGELGSVGTGGSDALEEVLNRNVPGAYLSSDLPDNYREKNLR
jgi:LPS-assembly protein